MQDYIDFDILEYIVHVFVLAGTLDPFGYEMPVRKLEMYFIIT